MQWMVWIGAAVTVAGLAGLVLAIRKALRVRRAELSEEEARAELARVVPLNLGSLLLSALGLMFVVVGIVLS